MQHQEKLTKLAKKAVNTKFPALYFEEGNGWISTFHPIFGLAGETILKNIEEGLNKNNVDPLLKLARKLNHAIAHLEKKQADFEKNLKSYTKYYLDSGKPDYLLNPDRLAGYPQVIAQLKEISIELRQILLHPTLEFLRVTDIGQADDQTNLHPAQVIFNKQGQYDILYRIMQYAGFFNLKLPKRQETQAAETNQSTIGSDM